MTDTNNATLTRIDDNDVTATGTHFCGRCAGTGQFVTMVVNGKPKGPGGICFRCGGKGRHDEADRRRNRNYDLSRAY